MPPSPVIVLRELIHWLVAISPYKLLSLRGLIYQPVAIPVSRHEIASGLALAMTRRDYHGLRLAMTPHGEIASAEFIPLVAGPRNDTARLLRRFAPRNDRVYAILYQITV